MVSSLDDALGFLSKWKTDQATVTVLVSASGLVVVFNTRIEEVTREVIQFSEHGTGGGLAFHSVDEIDFAATNDEMPEALRDYMASEGLHHTWTFMLDNATIAITGPESDSAVS